MAGMDDEFRARLLATFRAEAEEHIGEITGDLITMEKAVPSMPPQVIEQAYRKIHSLKEAASAVGQKEIETICQNLESVFAAIKKETYVPDSEAFDLIHSSLRIVREHIDGNPTAVTATAISRNLRGLISGKTGSDGPVRNDGHMHQVNVAVTRIPGSARDAEERISGVPGKPRTGEQSSPSSHEGKTVRIAAHRLGTVSSQALNRSS
jgi:two-component system chemotaxis sensor kinase CheA